MNPEQPERKADANVVSLADIRAKRLLGNATPEQWLKWATICNLVSEDYLAGIVQQNQWTVDELFTLLAEHLYGPDGPFDI